MLLDAFAGLVGQYERVEAASEAGAPFSEQVQIDWSIFAVDDPGRIHALLEAVFDGDNELVSTDARVRLRREEGADLTDHADAWNRFSKDLMYENRFFPSAASHSEFFTDLVQSRVATLDPGLEVFRARICESGAGHRSTEMSMPAPADARAGRANPVGIPHLYVALHLETCMRESRAVQHNFVTVATFEVTDSLRVLALDKFARLNPFEIETDAAAKLDAARTLERLGHELQKPVRPTDDEVEYVPTQYLSGLAKSVGLDGILFSSAQREGGTNLVLFSDVNVEIKAEPTTYEITEMSLQSRIVGS